MEVEEQNAEYERKERGGNSTNMIDKYTDIEQENIKNRQNR